MASSLATARCLARDSTRLGSTRSRATAHALPARRARGSIAPSVRVPIASRGAPDDRVHVVVARRRRVRGRAERRRPVHRVQPPAPRAGRARARGAKLPAQAHRHLLPVLPARHVQDARRRLRAGERPPLRPLRGPRGRRRGVRPRLAAPPANAPDRLARKKKLTRTAISSSAFQIRSAATRRTRALRLTDPDPPLTPLRARQVPRRPVGVLLVGAKARPSRPSVHRSILPLLRRRPAGLARRHALARRRGGGGGGGEENSLPRPRPRPRGGRNARRTTPVAVRVERVRAGRAQTREAGVDRGRRADPELAEEGGGAPGAVLQLGGRVFGRTGTCAHA